MLNVFSHPSVVQKNGLSPVCFRAWVFRWWLAANALSHPSWSHRNGFSLVCVRICFRKSLWVVKYLLQPSVTQLNVSPVCSLLCALNLLLLGFRALRVYGQCGPLDIPGHRSRPRINGKVDLVWRNDVLHIALRHAIRSGHKQ